MQDLSKSGRLITLGEVWVEYQRVRRLKPATVKCYSVCIDRCYSDWVELPIHLITKEMIAGRHEYMSDLRGRWKGEAQANLAMRVLRALITFASYKYPELAELSFRNPVKHLTELKAWNKVVRRKTNICRQLVPWLEAMKTFPYRTNRDFNLALLFTGCRKNELGTLPWNCVDFQTDTLFVKDTKNGRSLELPMSTHLSRLLLERSTLVDRDPRYVFTFTPGMPLHEDYRGYEAVIGATGIKYTFHDLRRTFATIADDLEMDDSLRKRLLNHVSNDVTDGYLCNGSERLRKPTQLINDEMLRRARLDNLDAFF